jgi:5-methyltetrahydropteroyltriglutamate--homocysteine methyltransferase
MILDRESGKPIDQKKLEATIQSGVEQIVQQQVKAGVDWINDGEASKASYMTYHTDRLTGYETAKGLEQNLGHFAAGFEGLEDRLKETVGASFAALRYTSACTGPITYIGHDAVQKDIDNLKRAAAGKKVEGLFMSSVSPGMLLLYPNKYYRTEEEYQIAVAEALREEYETINRAGIILQLDCPDFAGVALAAGPNGRKAVEERINIINHAVARIPPEMVQLHVCWGNLQVPHEHDVEFREFADVVLKAKPAGLSIEAANPRHGHEWKIFEKLKLPEGKYLIPGVIDVKTNIVEHPELIAQRIVQYAKLVGRENVIAGTDCGFASIVSLHTVLPDVAWEKLRAMRAGADLATRELWH